MMSAPLAAGRFVSRAAVWRRAVDCLLAGLVAFAPIARAVCDFEHIAHITGGKEHCAESDGASAHAGADDGSCCDSGPVSMTAQQRSAPADSFAGPALPAVFPALVAFPPPALRSRCLVPPSAGQTLPPYEPTFRRVPKLLI